MLREHNRERIGKDTIGLANRGNLGGEVNHRP